MHKHVRVWGGGSREVAGSHARMQGVLLYNNKFVVVTIPLPMWAPGWRRAKLGGGGPLGPPHRAKGTKNQKRSSESLKAPEVSAPSIGRHFGSSQFKLESLGLACPRPDRGLAEIPRPTAQGAFAPSEFLIGIKL